MMNIYVGNLPYSITENQLQEMFEQFGNVVSVRIIKDKLTGNAKGFAFVEMGDKESGQRAIDELNGKEIDGRAIKVNEAQPRTERPPRSGGGRPMRGGNGGGRDNRFRY